ncbi:DNA-processing protein DprA [Leucobacter komagatae]|uniref:DNA-processing protein DprA n=1 Tax=Leucobacter komagatae TaxID=55969 RepID=UPI000695E636|nr:DNA-processing protein DprA [Leucobacter komagatae]
MNDHTSSPSADMPEGLGATGDKRERTIRPDKETRGLLSELHGEDSVSEDALAVLLARAVWSRLAEPGDAAAGLLIGTLGPLRALDLIGEPHATKASGRALSAAPDTAGSLSATQLSAGLKRWRPRLDRAATVRDLRSAVATEMTLLTPESSLWPAQFDDLGRHAPLALWVRGKADTLASPSLAVVGARACTGYGSHVTADLTAEAGAAGFSIVSGAAYGIDAVAHRTALATGTTTIAVLAGGADRAYPVSHDQMLATIAVEGAICSELVPGAAPTRWRFLQRNRIIASLSKAVLVTEAGTRSGTLNTAGHAAELGRSLGAVPGPVTSGASAGCHRLIREYGATLVTNGAELRELLGVETPDPLLSADDQQYDPTGRSPSLHLRILDALPLQGSRSAADVSVRAGVSVEDATETLAELELLKYVRRDETADDEAVRWLLLRRE